VPADLIQLAVYVTVGMLFLLLLLPAMLHCYKRFWRFSKEFMGFVVLLVICGGMIDRINPAKESLLMRGIINSVDEGSEMVIMSLTTILMLCIK